MTAKARNLNPKSKKRLIFYYCIFIFAIPMAFLVYKSLTSQSVLSKQIIPEYNNLFTGNTLTKLELYSTYKSKNSYLTSSYYYDNKYLINVFKVPFINSSFKKVISEENRYPFNFGGFYDGGNALGINIDGVDTIKKVGIFFKGDSITTVIKNDTIVNYYLKSNKFSIYFNDGLSPNIKGEAEHDNTPFSLMFIKRNKIVYLIMMNIKEDGQTMKPDLLYSLINK